MFSDAFVWLNPEISNRHARAWAVFSRRDMLAARRVSHQSHVDYLEFAHGRGAMRRGF
jgi:hypothetical protein